MEAPSGLRSSTWRPKAVQEPNLKVQEPSEAFPMDSQELFRTSRTLKNHAPMQAGASFSCFCSIGFQRGLWAPLEASWAPLGLYLEGPGRLLGSTWSLLGPTWEKLGRSWGQLGRNLGGLWAILGALGAHFGPTWMHFGLPEPFKALSAAQLEAQSPPRSQFWRPRALSDGHFAIRCFSTSSTWRSKAVEEQSSDD